MNQLLAIGTGAASLIVTLPFLIMGGTYLGVTYGLDAQPCDNGLKKYGTVVGSLYMVVALVLLIAVLSGAAAISTGNLTPLIGTSISGIIFILSIIVFVGIYGWGGYLLFNKEGRDCWNKSRSKIWLAYTILWGIWAAGVVYKIVKSFI